MPALLRAFSRTIGLPTQLVQNSFLTYEGGICNKVTGTGIWLDQALRLLPADVWRCYVLSLDFGGTAPVDFRWDALAELINEHLVKRYDYFVHTLATISLKRTPNKSQVCVSDMALKTVMEYRSSVSQFLDQHDFPAALKQILELADRGSERLREYDRDERALDDAIFIAWETTSFLSIFAPETASKVWETFGFEGSASNVSVSGTERKQLPLHLSQPQQLFHLLDSASLKTAYSQLLRGEMTDWRQLLATRNIGEWCPCETWSEIL